MPEEKKVIEVPKDYADAVLEFPHTVQKGEAIVTCRVDVHEPLKKIGQKVPCSGCGSLFDVVAAQDEVQKK
jgi:hypothetical protein